MITLEEEKEFKKPNLYKIWNFLIYGSSIVIGVSLIYLYSAFVFINKYAHVLHSDKIWGFESFIAW